jgi:beta-N-acetylhexosaminidase
MRVSRRTIALLCVSLTAAGCASTDGASGPDPTTASGAASSAAPSSGGSSGSSSGPDSAPSAATTSPRTVKPSETRGCVDRIVKRLSPQQRLGQLVMVGLQAGTPTDTVTSLIRDQHVGNVIYLGGWEGAERIRGTSGELQQQVSKESTGGLRLFVAADQEGGQVWQIRGTGGERLPSALQQGAASSSQRRAYGTQIGKLLRQVGVNLNLAPVADTVPPEIGKANEPIGKWGRQYGNDPKVVSAAVPDLIRGLHDGGVATTVKHFPGIGRIRGNTDFTNKDVVDLEATRKDPYLKPFRSGIAAGADMVMVSSARYPKIDGDNPALFSSTIINDVLRRGMFYNGVVITDDVAAAAVRDVPAGERATRFIGAGGDILLTGQAGDVKPMLAALEAKAKNDPTFGKQVQESVRRVVALKVQRGLAACS